MNMSKKGRNMENRRLYKDMPIETFMGTYYLKSELVMFCKQEGLVSNGGKIALTDRIRKYLETGVKETIQRSTKKIAHKNVSICNTTKIEANFACTQMHRAFFEEQIGPAFSFRVAFQRWLKNNTGITYQEAIEAYYEIEKERKIKKKDIEPQFEYNTYMHDFYQENKGAPLADAIACWNFKKGKQGHHRYEKEDKIAIQQSREDG